MLTEDGSATDAAPTVPRGIGSINFSTGTVSLTLGALPDVGSQILFAWGTGRHWLRKLSLIPNLASRSVSSERPTRDWTSALRSKPNTLAITWNDGGA